MSENIPYGTQDTAPPSEPLTREEQYLSAIAGVTAATDIPPVPLTRVEKYLNKIVENGGGGGGGGTTDYNDLSNKPKLNNTELAGNLSLADVGAQAALDTDQMAAVNSGITSEKLGNVENDISTIQGKLTAHTAGGSNYDVINGIRVYVSATAPTGDIPTGSLWIGG